MVQPRVTDISHHNTVEDLQATAQAGIWAVIHKASQGLSYRDPDYDKRRQLTSNAGMLWGAYHFGDNSDPVGQVNNFLAAARLAPDTLPVLDYEDHPKGRASTMRPAQFVTFLREIERRTWRKAVIYSGNRLKEDIGTLSVTDRAYVCEHELWVCQYGPRPKLPMGFGHSFLWQYTDGVVGPQQHGIPGISGEVDLNAFNGTRDDLLAVWSGVPTDVSAQSRSRRAGDDDSGAPPATGGLNVRVPTTEYSIEVEVAQRELDAMGYHEVGDIDGYWGGKTAAGIKGFFIDRGLDDAAQMGPVLNNEIAKAKKDNWSRPIAPSRANAQPKDVAPKIEAVRVSLWQKFGAQIAAAVAGLGFTGSTLSSAFSDVQSKLQPMHDAFAKIPPEVWFGVVGLTALAVWYGSTRAARAATKDYNTGRLN